MQQLKRLVNEPTKPSLRYSLVPEPPRMTELEFWAALVNDYAGTAQRLPTLTSNKIRGGVPPPLRGVVWMSIAGSRDALLEEQYDRLRGETSPYENLIGKDIGRSFPGVEMFRDPSGDGQQMLARVLKCFSLYDHKIGYCQGLGLVVGPLLMHMGEKEAFCVLVRYFRHSLKMVSRPWLTFYKTHGTLRPSIMLFTGPLGTSYSNLSVPEASCETSSQALSPFGSRSGRTVLYLSMVPVLLCCHLSVANALENLRCNTDRRGF